MNEPEQDLSRESGYSGDAVRAVVRLHGSKRLLIFVLCAVLVILLVGGYLALRQWQSEERTLAERAFADKASLAASQLEALITTSLPQLEDAVERQLAQRDGFGPDDLARATASRQAWAVGTDGEVLVSTAGARGTPPDDAGPGEPLPGVSRVIQDRKGRDAIAVSLGFRGSEQIDSLVVVYPVTFASGFLGSGLDDVGSIAPSNGAIVDDAGVAVVTSGDVVDAAPLENLPLEGRLSGPVPVEGEEWRFASAGVGTAPWSVVIGAPESAIYSDADGLGGWTRWLVLLLFALLGFGGILLVVRVLNDASEIEKMSARVEQRRREAEQATEAKNDFISGMAHELRTPLAAITMFTDLMRRDTDDPVSEDQARNLNDINASAQHMLGLLDDAADIARVESGRLELRPERVSVAALAIGVVDSLHPLAAQRNVELQLEADAGIGEAYLDPARLRQVLINFLSNALKFTPPGGHANVRVTRHGPTSLVIAVEDDGIGIAPENRRRVFTSMSRLSKPLREQDANRGLGLALTKRIVEAMGGYVGVESELGSGSTFYAVLPRVNAERKAGVDPAKSASEETVAVDPPAGRAPDRRFSAIGGRTRSRNRRPGTPAGPR